MSSGVPTQAQVGYLVKQLQQEVRAAMDQALATHGTTMATYAAMAALAEDPDLSNAELARRCFVTPQTMNRIVRDLTDEGLVVRAPAPDHGRILQTSLTETGRARVAACRQDVDVVQDRMLRELDAAEVDVLTSLLTRCIAALRDEAPSRSSMGDDDAIARWNARYLGGDAPADPGPRRRGPAGGPGTRSGHGRRRRRGPPRHLAGGPRLGRGPRGRLGGRPAAGGAARPRRRCDPAGPPAQPHGRAAAVGTVRPRRDRGLPRPRRPRRGARRARPRRPAGVRPAHDHQPRAPRPPAPPLPARARRDRRGRGAARARRRGVRRGLVGRRRGPRSAPGAPASPPPRPRARCDGETI